MAAAAAATSITTKAAALGEEDGISGAGRLLLMPSSYSHAVATELLRTIEHLLEY